MPSRRPRDVNLDSAEQADLGIHRRSGQLEDEVDGDLPDHPPPGWAVDF